MKEKTKNVFIGVCIVLIGFLVLGLTAMISSNNKLKYENSKLNNNIEALNDTIRVTKTKAKQDEYNIRTFVVDQLAELKALNKVLAEEVRVTKGKVVSLQKTVLNIKDTTPSNVTVINNNKDSCETDLTLELNTDTTYSPGNYRKRKEIVKVTPTDNSSVVEDNMGVSLITGLKQNDKKDYEIFVRSNYPGLTVTGLEGAYIPRNQLQPPTKKKRFGVGFTIGYTPIAYDFDLKALKLRNQITGGVGFQYKF